MPIHESVFNRIDNFVWGLRELLGLTPASLIDLATQENDYTLVTQSGALYTQFVVDGFLQVIDPRSESGRDELLNEIHRQVAVLGSMLSTEGHIVRITWERDNAPTTLNQLVSRSIGPALSTCERFGFDLTDVICGQGEVLRTHALAETLTIGIYTTPVKLVPSDRRIAYKTRAEALAKLPKSSHAVMPSKAALTMLIGPHEAIINLFASSFPRHLMRRMTSHEVLRGIRCRIDPRNTPATWTPRLDSVPLYHRVGQNLNDASGIAPPPLSDQCLSGEFTQLTPQIVMTGGRLFASADVVIPPRSNARIEQFLQAVPDTSFRLSIVLRPGADRAFPARLRTIFSKLSTDIATKRAYLGLSERDIEDARVGISMAITTWHEGIDSPENRENVLSNLSKVCYGIGAWGDGQSDMRVVSAKQSFFSGIPGCSLVPKGNEALPRLSDALALLPLQRQGSPFLSGSALFRTQDGRVMPFEPFSAQQSAWITLILAGTGGGKTFLANYLQLADFTAMQDKAPRLVVLDIGDSSGRIAELLSEVGVPVLKANLANIPEFGINPLDGGILGMRNLLPEKRSSAVALFELICARVSVNGQMLCSERVSDFLAAIIDLAIQYSMPGQAQCKMYARGHEMDIDVVLDHYEIDALGHNLSWFEVCDVLHELYCESTDIEDSNVLYGLAFVAHARAVPTIQDLVSLCMTEVVMSRFGDAVEDQQRLPAYVHERLMGAQARFPILAGHTQFRVNKQVVVLNLERLIPRSGAALQSDITGPLMMMLATSAAADVFWRDPSDIERICAQESTKDTSDPAYKRMVIPTQYRESLIRESREFYVTPKSLVIDEAHRLFSIQSATANIISKMREARTRKIRSTFITHKTDDVPPVLMDLASTVIYATGLVLQPNDSIGLSESQITMVNNLPSPSAQGAHYVMRHNTVNGFVTNHVILTVSGQLYWSFTTNADEKSIRAMLNEKLGAKEARRRLAHRFPSGMRHQLESLRAQGASLNVLFDQLVIGE